MFERRAVEIDQIDLVDSQHDLPDAQQAHDHGMTAGLAQQAFARVDQQHREIGVRRAGRHVTGVLFVTRRIGHDEGPPLGREITVGHVDGNALLALGLEPIQQQRIVDVAAGGAVAFGIAAERFAVIVEDQILFVQQPADQRRLAVVDRAARQKPQGRPRGDAGRLQASRGAGREHQKYPSRFLASIEPDES